jgi:hypothetical protein
MAPQRLLREAPLFARARTARECARVGIVRERFQAVRGG